MFSVAKLERKINSNIIHYEHLKQLILRFCNKSIHVAFLDMMKKIFFYSYSFPSFQMHKLVVHL